MPTKVTPPTHPRERVARAIAREVMKRLQHTLTENQVTAYMKLQDVINETKDHQQRLVQEIVDNARDRGMI